MGRIRKEKQETTHSKKVNIRQSETKSCQLKRIT